MRTWAFSTTRRGLTAWAVIVLTLGVHGVPAHALAAENTIPELRWALPSIPDTLLVGHAWSTYSGAIVSLVQEGTLAFGDDLKLAPAIADSWKQTDPTTYVYHLRQGVTFSDGKPLTADDVVFSMKWNMDSKNRSQLASFYAGVTSIEATGDREVTVKLDKPNTQFQYTVAHMAGFVMEKAQMEAHPDDYGSPDVLPVGTGPFKLTEFAPGDHVTLEANDAYWGGAPKVRKITISAIPDQQARLLAMRNGDIDGTFDLPISDIEQWKKIDTARIVTAPSLGVYLLTMDRDAAPFDDVHVRRALSYAVDRKGLVAALLKGLGAPATAINPPGIWAGVLTADEATSFYDGLNPYAFDLEKAKAELKQSKVPDGFSVKIESPNSVPYVTQSLVNLASNLAQIGITLDVQEVDHSQWLSDYFGHENLGLSFMSYFPDYPDPANYPYLFFSSSTAVKDGLNGSNFKNPEVDAALATALQNSDPAARATALKQVFKITNDDATVVSLFWPDTAMAINSKYDFTGFNAFWYNVPWAIRGLTPKP
ncbi:MAG: ABC transporter substrate-binding protein [Inquilinus sp.]|uniref:ABC transporter substrate-binding protein n=1 Tax=Inquilinus sp. TaxID=1932117 RepID=UPI003F31AC16